MRAKEFIREQHELEFAADHKDWEPREVAGAYIIPDASNNFYNMYRYGILMARSPEPQPDAYDDQTAIGDKLIIAPYGADIELEIVKGASKASGHGAKKAHRYTSTAEHPDVNQVSPVNANSGKKRNASK
jgi:hypothetical protein